MIAHKCRILLVDDSPQVREALCDLLAHYNDIQVIGEAADGKQAIELIDACQPDVILLDLNMPVMNGIETANLIKKSWANIVIIGLCVIQDAYSMDAFLRAGALAVVFKDRIADLHSVIERACRNRASMTPHHLA